MKITHLMLIASGVALAGCTNLNDPMSSNEGQVAVKNFAAQVEDPTADKGAPSMSASMSDAAIERYEAGEVGEAPEEDGASFTFNMEPSE